MTDRQPSGNHCIHRIHPDPLNPLIMGILNVTPDSFSDGGRYSKSTAAAVQRAQQMISEGADVIDIGGESSRPGAQSVSAEEEIKRVVPVIRALRQVSEIPISVDTCKTEVMAAALEAGADIINDIRALTAPGALSLVAAYGAQTVLMHMRGSPETMQDNPVYTDVTAEVAGYLQNRATVCIAAGIRAQDIILDPGFGFGKSTADCYTMLSGFERFCALGHPVMAALSRKSMIGAATGQKDPEDRLAGSVCGMLLCVLKGAGIVRVHDVAATRDALRVLGMAGIRNFT